MVAWQPSRGTSPNTTRSWRTSCGRSRPHRHAVGSSPTSFCDRSVPTSPQLANVLRAEQTPSARSRQFAHQFLRPLGPDQPVSPILGDEIERAATLVKRHKRSTPAWHSPLRPALLAWLRRRAVAKQTVEDATIIGTSMSLRPVKTALEEIQQGTAPVFIGPWLDSIGDELLYWIPFVRWIAATYGIAPERLIVLSRSGVGEWYGPLATRYLDVRKLFSPAELDHWTHRSVPQREQDPKQAVMAPFDHEVVERAARAFDLSDWQVLHPLMLFRVLGRLHKDRALAQMADVLRYEPLDAAVRERPAGLPPKFVAVSIGFTAALPKDEENERFLTELLAKVAARHNVVIVDSQVPADVQVPSSDRVHLLVSLLPEMDPLRAQIQAIAHARAFMGGYGDLAILAAFCGIPTTAYHSERMPADQPDRVQSASVSGKWGTLTLERARRFKGVRLPAEAHA
jgi:hypothetical protein